MATTNPLLHPISTLLRLSIVFLSLLTMISSGGAIDAQLTALLDVAKAIGHPKNLTLSWQGEDFCHNWEFITCTPDRNVTIINFEKQHLSGTISPAFANLTSLTTLKLNDNNLTGSIPDVLATLPHLEFLDVSYNNLSGKLLVFPSTMKFLAAGNDHMLLGYSANGSGEKSNGSFYRSVLVVMLGLLEILGAVLVLAYVVKKNHQRSGWENTNIAVLSKLICVLAVAILADVGVLLVVSNKVNPQQQRCSGENKVLMVTGFLALLVLVGALLLVSDNKKKKQHQKFWLVVIFAVAPFLVFMGVMSWLLFVIEYFNHGGV